MAASTQRPRPSERQTLRKIDIDQARDAPLPKEDMPALRPPDDAGVYRRARLDLFPRPDLDTRMDDRRLANNRRVADYAALKDHRLAL